MIKQYSLLTDKNMKLSTNFTVKEFACKDGSNNVLIDTNLITLLQKIRDHFKKPVTINSGYRNISYNKKIGGATNSQHTKGTAADIVVEGVNPSEVAKYVEFIMSTTGGIGLYDTFVHVDVRTNRSRWRTKNNKETVVNGFYGYDALGESINILVNKKIISEPKKWQTKPWSQENMSCLIIKMAQYINQL